MHVLLRARRGRVLLHRHATGDLRALVRGEHELVDMTRPAVAALRQEVDAVVTRGGDDTIIDPDELAVVVSIWNPLDED